MTTVIILTTVFALSFIVFLFAYNQMDGEDNTSVILFVLCGLFIVVCVVLVVVAVTNDKRECHGQVRLMYAVKGVSVADEQISRVCKEVYGDDGGDKTRRDGKK